MNLNNQSKSSKKISHDLGNVLGNLRTMEILLFRPGHHQDCQEYQKTFQDLLKRLEEIQKQVANSGVN